MTTASASSSVSNFDSPSLLATRVTEASISPPRSSSRTSRPSSVSLPTIAIVLLSNLLLRRPGTRRPVPVSATARDAAHNAGDAQGDAGSEISGGEREKERLAEVPGQVNGHGDWNERDRRSRLEQVDFFKAGIAPGADHQE